MTQKRRKGRYGTLRVVGGLLITSAILRFMDGTGQAYAEGEPAPAMLAEAEAEMASTAEPDVTTLLGALQAREARLEKQESALADRLQALAVTEAEVAEQIAALVAAEDALRSTIALAEEAAQTDLGRLTTVYENMKPKDAAALFEEMSPDFAAGFLGMMRPEPAALIMTQLEPETAHSISVVLAGRNAGVPTQ